MDAIKHLMEDHRRVEELISRFESLKERAARLKVVQELSKELHLHTHEEEAVFYPAVREATKDRDMITHALSEHQKVKDVLAALTNELDDQQLAAKVMQIKQLLKDHIEEEETEMFPKTRERVDAAELGRLGERMARDKQEYRQKVPQFKVTMAPESEITERQQR